ncbi:MAG: FGGY family carbohydrate kinase [Planctomycetales bacterium]
MNYLLGLDLGTTSVAAVALGLDGKLIAEYQASNNAAISGLPAGHAEQDPRRIREVALEVLRTISGRMEGKPIALGITGQMHGMVAVDGNNLPVTNLITWQDRRANEPYDATGETFLEQIHRRCSPEMFVPTGVRLAAGFVGTTLFILKRRGQLPPQTKKVLILADWIASQLTGEDPVTDRGNAASTGMYDQQHDRWSKELFKALELPIELFPPVRESGDEIGQLTAEMAAATGLPQALPLCNAIGDNQAAVMGSFPAGEPGIHINIGTGGQISWPLSRFVRVEGTETRYLPIQRYMLVGAGLAGGESFAWVQRTISSWLAAYGVNLTSDEVYAKINELAASVPENADGLQCRPVFRGTRRDPGLRGSFSGVSHDNFSLGHVARSVMQGIANGMHEFLDIARDYAPRGSFRIIGAGNGLRQNKLLTRIISEKFQAPVYFAGHPQEAAYGAALLAGVQMRNWPSLEEAGKSIRLVPAEEVQRSL